MPITPISEPNFTPREGVILDVQLLLDEAACSLDNIDPYGVATQILDAIEAKINSVDQDGNVIYCA